MSAAQPNTWTPERVETLTALWEEGLSCREIATRLGGVTRSAVIGKVHRLGLDGRENPSKPGSPRASLAHKPTTKTLRAPPVKRAPGQNNGLVFQSRKRGKGAVKPEPVASAEPQVIVRKDAWAPLPGSTPRPWTERGFGCAWPVDVLGSEVQHSCCRPKKTGHPRYCPEHATLGVSKVNASAPRGARLVRSLRKFAA